MQVLIIDLTQIAGRVGQESEEAVIADIRKEYGISDTDVVFLHTKQNPVLLQEGTQESNESFLTRNKLPMDAKLLCVHVPLTSALPPQLLHILELLLLPQQKKVDS